MTSVRCHVLSQLRLLCFALREVKRWLFGQDSKHLTIIEQKIHLLGYTDMSDKIMSNLGSQKSVLITMASSYII